MKERMIVSTFTLAGTLAFYYYGRTHSKDAIPYMIAGELIGAIMGEILVYAINRSGK